MNIIDKSASLTSFFADKTLEVGQRVKVKVLEGEFNGEIVDILITEDGRSLYEISFRKGVGHGLSFQKVFIDDLRILGKPVYLTDIVKKIYDRIYWTSEERRDLVENLCDLMFEFDFKSLNELFAEEKTDYIQCHSHPKQDNENCLCCNPNEFKNQNIQNLAKSLWGLFKDQLK